MLVAARVGNRISYWSLLRTTYEGPRGRSSWKMPRDTLSANAVRTSTWWNAELNLTDGEKYNYG